MCVLQCLVSHIRTLCNLMDCSLPGSSCPQGFSRQEYWSGLLCPPPGNLLNPGIKPRCSTLQADSLPFEPPANPKNTAVGSLSLLQGIFLTQESNQGLLRCRQILYQLSYLSITCDKKMFVRKQNLESRKRQDRSCMSYGCSLKVIICLIDLKTVSGNLDQISFQYKFLILDFAVHMLIQNKILLLILFNKFCFCIGQIDPFLNGHTLLSCQLKVICDFLVFSSEQ